MNVFLVRARRALKTARSNLADGDTLAAGNRVYYALFDALRAVLSARNLADLGTIRTHHGIDHVFRMSVVKAGLMEDDVFRIVRKALELRSDADYGTGPDIDPKSVEAALEEAVIFVDACAKLVQDFEP